MPYVGSKMVSCIEYGLICNPITECMGPVSTHLIFNKLALKLSTLLVFFGSIEMSHFEN